MKANDVTYLMVMYAVERRVSKAVHGPKGAVHRQVAIFLGGWGRLFEKMTLEHGVENCEAGCRVLKALSQESAFSVGGTPEGPE